MQIKLIVSGMTCGGCEKRINKALAKLDGIDVVNVSYEKAEVEIRFEEERLGVNHIKETIEALGYTVMEDGGAQPRGTLWKKLAGLGLIAIASFLLVKTDIFTRVPQVESSMGYGLLFVIGFLTSFHCIAMCGGINLSQCVQINKASGDSAFTRLRPSILYNLGRVLSYTLIGGIVGALGSVISISGKYRGVVVVVAGIFMILMGLRMLDIFPWLRHVNLSFLNTRGNKSEQDNRRRGGPLAVGLLNGLMPCGPLQTMQLYAMGTGSFLTGALSMFMFSLGTVPLLFGLGLISTILSARFNQRMVKAGAFLVIILGIAMASRGLNLSGINLTAANQASGSIARLEGAQQVVTTVLQSGRYAPFVVQKGVPVKWIIKATADDINGCNNPVTIPKYGIEKRLVPGDNIIEFTPEEEGAVIYTCWMGMISSTIRVVPDIANVTKEDIGEVDSGGVQNNPGGCCG